MTPVCAAKDAVRVRSASPVDAAALFELEQASFPGDRISRRSWSRLLISNSAAVAVVEQAGATLGAIVVLYRTGSSVARIYSLAVSAIARGRGMARLLLEYAIERARADGSSVLRLETRVDNRQAQLLFIRLGFGEFARRPEYYEDGAEAIRYQKYLGQATASISKGKTVAIRPSHHC